MSATLKYRHVEHALAQRIQRGDYAQGLPGERALATEFSVARVTVRSALRALEDAGLIKRQQRRGTQATGGPDMAARRRLLREHVDKFLDRGRRDHRKVLYFGRVGASASVATSLQVPAGTEVIHIARLRSDDTAPLTYTETYLPVAIGHPLTRAELERKALVQILEASGTRIASAEQRFTCIPAPSGAAQHLGITEGAPVWKIHRVLFDSQGKPLQFLLGWYRADRFEIGMRLSLEEDATKVWFDYQ
ncbi:GntR family transcriptional regulator [Ottowia thiooxydans]|uniref:GntR family transcriptional regulator n=1 Tax=Ottowia thiooxydans TaxID=219182 RepID=UPI00040DEA8C|nr:GntR family transcriptional regulator [Ottowia thiooxydans]